jgi:predicted PurR-regulated permease PerM
MSQGDDAAKRGGRGRAIFLGASAVAIVAVLLWAREVMLPFLLALVIAYVLTPAVAWLERRRLPRAAAILVIYATLLGAIGIFIRFATPRIGGELRNLRDEIPALAKEAKEKWAPAIGAKMRELGLASDPAPPSPPADQDAAKPAGAIVVRPLDDDPGAYVIDVGSGVSIVETKRGYVVEPVRPQPQDTGFDPSRLIADTLGKGFAYAQENTLELAKIGRDIVAGVSRAIFIFFITLMLAAYVMMTREKVFAFFRSLVRPSNRASYEKLIARMDRGLAGVVRGQLIICLINGVLSAIGFAIVGLKYWPVLALVAAVLSLIPIFGSIISSIPAVAVGLTQGIGTAVFVLVWIVGIHQLEANLLNPKIMGDAAKIHPVLVVFSLLVGEHFFGAVGALLAVPTMSLAKSVFLHFRDITNAQDPELASEVAPSSGEK